MYIQFVHCTIVLIIYYISDISRSFILQSKIVDISKSKFRFMLYVNWYLKMPNHLFIIDYRSDI